MTVSIGNKDPLGFIPEGSYKRAVAMMKKEPAEYAEFSAQSGGNVEQDIPTLPILPRQTTLRRLSGKLTFLVQRCKFMKKQILDILKLFLGVPPGVEEVLLARLQTTAPWRTVS